MRKKDQKPDKKKDAPTRRQRPTIGLLDILWARSEAVAQKWDANQIEFMCCELRSPKGFEAEANVIAGLVSPEKLDGLVIWSDYIGHYLSPEEMRRFCEQYHPLPVVSIGLVEGFPTILVDNYQGAYEAIVHLIQVHGYRRIACIRGPEGNVEAEERYRAYVDALAEYEIPLDKELVVTGGFVGDLALAALKQLLDERQASFEALVTVSDLVAFMAIEALQARGISVPGEVAVVGFDNMGADYYPPLTSVQAPWPEAIEKGVEMLLALLAGEQIPERIVLSSQLVVRQSCGCHSPLVLEAATQPAPEVDEALKIVRWNELYPMLRSAVVAACQNLDPAGVTQLLDAFGAELEKGISGEFLLILERLLQKARRLGDNISAWHRPISMLRHQALPYLAGDTQKLAQAEALWHQARVLISQVAESVRTAQVSQTQQQLNKVHEVGQRLIMTSDVAELLDVLARELPHLGIPACYLALYEEPQTPAGWARLIMAYDENGRIALAPGGERFPARQLLPDGLLSLKRRYNLAIAPLYFQKEQLGFIVFKAGLSEEAHYYVLSDDLNNPYTLQLYISSALRSALLMQQIQRHTLTLENEVAARTQDLHQATEALKNYSEKLEEMVEERTEALQSAQEQLIRQEKLAILGQLAGGIGHELRNPLGVITNAVYFLQMVLTEPDETIKEYLELISERVHEVDKIVADLLSLSRTRPGTREGASVLTLVEEALQRCPPPEGVTIHRLISADLLPIEVDPQQTGLILTNLIINAYQAMPEGGTVTFEAKLAGQEIRLTVADTGIGMSPEVMAKIFEPLYTTKAKGIGLGLAVSKNLVEVNGGRLEVESQQGQGAIFTLSLPIYQGASIDPISVNHQTLRENASANPP